MAATARERGPIMRAIESMQEVQNEESVTTEAIEKIAEEIRQAPTTKIPMPPLDPIEVARQRVEQLVSDVSDHTILELGKAAEEIQSLMQVLGDERKAITGQVQRYADFAAKAIKAKIIIAGHLVQLREERND